MGVRSGRQDGHLPNPWKFGPRTKNFQKSGSEELNSDYLISFLHWQFIFRYDTHTALKPGSLFWFHAVMSFHFTHVRSLSCRGKLRN